MLKKLLSKKNDKKQNLDTLFYPKSIAIIGASNDTAKIGGYIFEQIKNKAQHINLLPINPTSLRIQDIDAYQDITQIHKELQPDLIIIAIPKQFIIKTLNQIAKTSTKNIVIITAGFKETGEHGKEEELEIKKIIKQNNFNLIGPNCLGFLNPEINLNCSFAKDIPKAGSTALVSQSGAVIDAIIDWSFEQNIGFSKIVSLGNMAGIDELEILEYLKNDEQTKSIVFYMETLEKGVEFGNLLKEISKTKPVIIIKPGSSQQAKSAIGSHTGSLAQDNILVKTLIKNNNGILVDNLDELFNIMIGLKSIDNIISNDNPTNNKNEHINDTNINNTVILTNAGGPGVIATDELAKTNLNLYQFTDKQKIKLQKNLPAEASINNPIDILGDAKSDRYTTTLNELIKIKEIKNIIILLTPQIMTDSENIAKSIIEISNKINKNNNNNNLLNNSNKNNKNKVNIYTSFLGYKQVKHAKTLFNLSNFPTFNTPNAAITTLSKLVQYKSFNYESSLDSNISQLDIYNKFNKNTINNLNEILENKSGLLDQKLTNKILKSLNITPFEKQFVENIHDIFKLKINPNQKYVIKADAKELIHKKEFNAIKLNINSNNYKEEIEKMLKEIEKTLTGLSPDNGLGISDSSISKQFTITIEKQIKGIETIVGLKSDESLGNFIMFGMGGTYVNIFKDVNFMQAPLNTKTTKELIQSSKVSKLLNGYRGDKPVNLKKLEQTILNISYIQKLYPIIKEVDFNPIICDEHDCYLVDAKLILE
ncbi:MAG: acetate--CoA ligase family protein [Nanoarchaeales archaeon]|nr:acetate--CoA ligase family protein [Nanoarchaeales archaeon]